jgi:16S rRNA (uracil1498-N3)-methyltransferase
MNERAPKVRLFVTADLAPGATVAPTAAQTRYLLDVMRLGAGDAVALFNGRDGEWRAAVTPAGRRRAALAVEALLRPQTEPPDVELLFAPLKKARTDFLVEKATELGARRLRPVLTRRTGAERVNVERLAALAAEAAEQCGALAAPAVAAPERLDAALAGWEAGRRLMVADEARDAPPALTALRDAGHGPWAILVGPEGGFDPAERAALTAAPFVTRVSLGPRILRAETAAAVALALWQAALGDCR